MLNWKDFGSRVRSLRKSLHLTLEDLSQRIGLTPTYLGHLERGSREISLETLVSLCNELNISPDYLLFGNLHDIPDLHLDIGVIPSPVSPFFMPLLSAQNSLAARNIQHLVHSYVRNAVEAVENGEAEEFDPVQDLADLSPYVDLQALPPISQILREDGFPPVEIPLIFPDPARSSLDDESGLQEDDFSTPLPSSRYTLHERPSYTLRQRPVSLRRNSPIALSSAVPQLFLSADAPMKALPEQPPQRSDPAPILDDEEPAPPLFFEAEPSWAQQAHLPIRPPALPQREPEAPALREAMLPTFLSDASSPIVAQAPAWEHPGDEADLPLRTEESPGLGEMYYHPGFQESSEYFVPLSTEDCLIAHPRLPEREGELPEAMPEEPLAAEPEEDDDLESLSPEEIKALLAAWRQQPPEEEASEPCEETDWYSYIASAYGEPEEPFWRTEEDDTDWFLDEAFLAESYLPADEPYPENEPPAEEELDIPHLFLPSEE